MPSSTEAADVDNVFIDAAIRSHAKSAIEGFQTQGLLATFPFESTMIQRVLSPLTGFWEYTVGHKHTVDLPIVQAGLSVAPNTLEESSFIRLSQMLQTAERTHILLMIQAVYTISKPDSPIIAFAAELNAPAVQAQKTVGLTYAAATREKILMYRSAKNGQPLFEPVKLRAIVPALFDENELPSWGFSQSALAVFDEEKAHRMIRGWQRSLTADMTQTNMDDALNHISSQIISI